MARPGASAGTKSGTIKVSETVGTHQAAATPGGASCCFALVHSKTSHWLTLATYEKPYRPAAACDQEELAHQHHWYGHSPSLHTNNNNSDNNNNNNSNINNK